MRISSGCGSSPGKLLRWGRGHVCAQFDQFAQW
ncbi:hypothetical protein [Aurantimicrobium minutum]